MAYSDYGGYAYRNGERIVERSDAVLTTEGLKSSPGAWPGWTIPEAQGGGSYHAILGDGPIYVGLYKQSDLRIYCLGEELEETDLADNPLVAVEHWEFGGKKGRSINVDHFKTTGDPCIFNVDGHRIEAYFLISDNHYQYVRLTQPDGVVWTGFAGYGVGAGLEDAGYGYDTDEQVEKLRELFPWQPTPAV